MNTHIAWIAGALVSLGLTACDGGGGAMGDAAMADAAVEDARVRRDGALLPSAFEQYIGGVAILLPDGEGLEGVRACILEHPEIPCVVSGRGGGITIGPVPRRERVRIELTHPDTVRQILLWESTNLSRPELLLYQVTPALMTASLEERGIDADLSLGLVGGYIADRDSRGSGLVGATLTLDGENAGPVFLDQLSPPFTSPTPTPTELGLFLFGNVAPGEHVLGVDAPGHVCIEGLRWPRALNEMDVPVEANTITTMYLICPPLAKIEAGDECVNARDHRYGVCEGSAPGCIRRDAGSLPVCVEDVGPCADEADTCVGDVLLTGCRNLQPSGIDCFALGGRCDPEVGACVDLAPGSYCDDDSQCADGMRCSGWSGDARVCAVGLDCAGYFQCNVACADSACVQDCYDEVFYDSLVFVDQTYECFAEAECAPSLLACQRACPVPWAVCLEN